MDFSTITCPKVKAFMLLDQHRKFVGFNADSESLSAAMDDLLLRFALHVLNSSSDTTGDEEVRAPARAFKEEVTVVSASTRANAWEMPHGLSATQVMRRAIFEFISTL